MNVHDVLQRHRRLLGFVELSLWSIGAILLGIYGLVYLDRSIYQAFQAWAFDRELTHEPAPMLGFVYDSLRFGTPQPEASADRGVPVMKPAPAPNARPRTLPTGGLIGRLEIPSARVRAMVIQGTSDEILRRAVGHIEGTAAPGETGNVGLAGHRDTFFRGLQHVHKGDRIVLRTLDGSYEYEVESIQIVGPDDVDVLNASSTPTLTLVTCYPFEYVGSAPRRFVVHAREVSAPPPTARMDRGS